MNRQLFFDAVRRSVFRGRLTPAQVSGMEALLDAFIPEQMSDLRHQANVLSQVHRETGGRMAPVRETFADSDAQAIRRLDAAWAAGQLTWVKKPYWRDGWFGRGAIQITHEAMYRKLGKRLSLDLVGNRELTLEPTVSAHIAVVGMAEGLFTGKKLADYFNGGRDDPAAARAIVNGDGKSVGPEIARHHALFLDALAKASALNGAASSAPAPTPRPPLDTSLKPADPRPPSAPPDIESPVEPALAQSSSWRLIVLAAIIILSIIIVGAVAWK
jgi:putative chitinase